MSSHKQLNQIGDKLDERIHATTNAVRGPDLRSYESNRLVRSSVEREFIIIGEALGALHRLSEEIFGSITQARRIVDFRNPLMHQYPEVKDMSAHRVETVIRQGRTVVLKDLPFQVGESVEVIISHCSSKRNEKDRYPLRGAPIKYVNPAEPVAHGDWSVSQ